MVIRVLHTAVVLMVLAFCLLQGFKAVSNYGNETIALTFERGAISLLCGSYAAAQLLLLHLKRLTTQAFILFYPLCLLLAVVSMYVLGGFAKGWAPATASEAHDANIMGFTIVAVLVVACIASCSWAVAKGRRNA